jgi:peptidoglycan/LPS O-acetylase OafA/YrhL
MDDPRRPPVNRVGFIDGLRGVAILLVILFHAYAAWPSFVPYGNTYADLFPMKFGYLGVQLFFLISGFVILMTLEKSVSFRQFLFKRWVRLIPGMLVCALIIYGFAIWEPARPSGEPQPLQLLPPLLLIHPKLVSMAVGANVTSLEGAFWSIYVEVQFYVFFGFMYFWRGRTAALIALLAVYVAWLVLRLFTGPGGSGLSLLTVLGAMHFAWFLAGALFFLHFNGRGRRFGWLALAATGAALLQFSGGQAAAAAFIAACFAVPVCWPPGRAVPTSRVLLVVGVASYPLYLLHQNIMIVSIGKLAAAAPIIPGALLPPLVVAVLLIASTFIATRVEPAIKTGLTLLVGRKVAAAAAT